MARPKLHDASKLMAALAGTPKTLSELAAATGISERTIYRIMKKTNGIFGSYGRPKKYKKIVDQP